MTPKARREQQLNRESAARGDTEAAIEVFKAGRRVHEPTRLLSKRKTRKHSARCSGCEAAGFPLEVWEFHDVESGPAILCDACAATAERNVRPPVRSAPSRWERGGGSHNRRT
jgi:hypothetical protein